MRCALRPTPRLAYAVLLAGATLAAVSSRAGEGEPLLPPQAFRTVPSCSPIDPFVDVGPEQRVRRSSCAEDAPWRLAVRTPRARPTDTGPARVEVDLDRQFGMTASDFSGQLRVGMAAASRPDDGRLQPRRALLAAQGRLQWGERLSLDLGLAQDVVPVPRRRALAAATLHADGRHLLFLQLASEPDGRFVPSFGLRWWLAPGRASLDLGARRSPEGELVDPRLGLRLTGG